MQAKTCNVDVNGEHSAARPIDCDGPWFSLRDNTKNAMHVFLFLPLVTRLLLHLLNSF